MTETTREVVQQFLAALAARDPGRLTQLCAEQIDWHIPGNESVAPWVGRRADRAGVLQYAESLFAQTRPVSATIHHIYIDGEAAVVTGEFITEMLATGRHVESPFSAEFLVRDGQIVRYRLLEDSHAVVQSLTRANS